MKRLLVGITGASGVIIGVRLLEELARAGMETHLVASPAAVRTLALECPERSWQDVRRLAHTVHEFRDIAAPPSSGSWQHAGMAVVPCSLNTASSLAAGIAGNLLVRAADVTLKERRNLVVVPREAPLHAGHLQALARLAELGACVLPPVLTFYNRPTTLEDAVNWVVGRVLDQLAIEHALYPRWEGGTSGRDHP